LGRPTILVTVGGIAGQVFALVRTLYVANRVGTSASLDALLVAEVFPVVVAGIIVSGLRNAMVPAYLDVIANRGRDEGSRFVGFVVTWSAIVATAAVFCLFAFSGAAVGVAGMGLAAPAREESIGFLPILAPILALTVVWILLTTVCQAEQKFVPIAIGLVLNPLASLVVTVGVWNDWTLRGLAAGMTIGYVATVLFMIGYLLVSGLRVKLALTFHRSDVIRFLRHAAPLVAGASVVQFNLLADRATASILVAGSVSALNYGQLVVTQAIGSLSTAWMLVLYPSLVRLAKPSGAALGEGTSRAMRMTIALFTPLVVATAALAPLGVQVAYERGAFNAQATATTASVVAAFAPMILLMMLQPVLTGAHNARRRGNLIGLTAVLNAVLNVVLDVVLGLNLGVAGIALSTTITLTVVAAILVLELRRLEPGFELRPVLSTARTSLLASLVPGIPIACFVWLWLPRQSFLVSSALLAALIVAGAVAYLAVGLALGLEELRSACRNFVSQMSRRWAPSR
jgi:putative peptidoglycan lipid II flippase